MPRSRFTRPSWWLLISLAALLIVGLTAACGGEDPTATSAASCRNGDATAHTHRSDDGTTHRHTGGDGPHKDANGCSDTHESSVS